jgi:uncharacterized protein YfdQ (DUF2303 family)
MQDINPKSLNELVRLGTDAAKPREVPGGNIPYALVPEGFTLQTLENFIHNEHNATPERVKATVSVLDAESFVEYYTLFNDPNSRMFADETNLSVTAILDYHAAGEGTPRWGHHRLKLGLRKSVEWERWTGSNGKQLTQQQFAEFLEQNSLDISSPSPASIVEVARDLDAHTEVEFGAGQRMENGQVRFRYTEQIKATVGGGSMEVPERFTLSISVFIGGTPIAVDALLRFRVKDGKLVLWYTLIRPEQATRDAFLAIRNQIADVLKLTIINGTPNQG